jgi:membrane-bound lytic murein transglycosylase D
MTNFAFAKNSTYPRNPGPAAVAYNLPESILNDRIEKLQLPLEARVTDRVRSKINMYVVNGAHDAELMLGRTAMYFPIFEHYLRVHQLPEALKYLPLVESGLRPSGVSSAGAAGLWQFVPTTARAYGLRIDGTIDERLDTYRATEAAVKMLKQLHARFGDWALALAAYNCGPGRVNQAIRQAGQRNFWAIQRFLPLESQRYVPRFIAAAYLVNYYQMHGLNPRFPDYNLYETRVFRVHDQLSLSQIAQETGVDRGELAKLNPALRQGYIPATREGYYLILPAAVAPAFAERYGQVDDQATPTGRFRSNYVAVVGDDIATLAMLFDCTVEDLMAWNSLASAEVVINQPLIVYLPEKPVRP